MAIVAWGAVVVVVVAIAACWATTIILLGRAALVACSIVDALCSICGRGAVVGRAVRVFVRAVTTVVVRS